MKAIILVGGEGLRLRKIIKDVPKPMAEVCGRPFLEYLILQLAKYRIREIILSIGYKRDIIKEYFGNGRRWGVEILYSEEDEPLGTGGGARQAARTIEDKEFIVMNGDVFLDLNLDDIAAFHKDRGAECTIGLVRASDARRRYGKVEIADNNEVTAFAEKEGGKKGYINGGVYIFNRKVFNDFPAGRVSLEREIFPILVNRGLYGMEVKGFFIDIGVPEKYLALCKNPSKLLNAVGL